MKSLISVNNIITVIAMVYRINLRLGPRSSITSASSSHIYLPLFVFFLSRLIHLWHISSFSLQVFLYSTLHICRSLPEFSLAYNNSSFWFFLTYSSFIAYFSSWIWKVCPFVTNHSLVTNIKIILVTARSMFFHCRTMVLFFSLPFYYLTDHVLSVNLLYPRRSYALKFFPPESR